VATEKGLVETARALSIAVDREVSASVSVLEALATSPRLETGDLKSFYADARSLLSVRGAWGNIILYDPQGQQLLNTVRPFGEPLPVAANYQLIRRVAQTRSAAISDLFTGAVLRKPILLVLVPVVQGNAIRHVLGATIAPTILTNVLLQQKPARIDL
jgi:hypothetical protein